MYVRECTMYVHMKSIRPYKHFMTLWLYEKNILSKSLSAADVYCCWKPWINYTFALVLDLFCLDFQNFSYFFYVIDWILVFVSVLSSHYVTNMHFSEIYNQIFKIFCSNASSFNIKIFNTCDWFEFCYSR